MSYKIGAPDQIRTDTETGLNRCPLPVGIQGLFKRKNTMNKYRNYTDEEILQAFKTSKSFAGVLRKLNLLPVGGNYKTLHKWIQRLNPDLDHMTYQGWNKDNEHVPLDELKKPSCIKKRLFKERGHGCEGCGLTKWMGKQIPIELEHIDGNSSNNHRDNLKLLCPNCHALTPTWKRRKSSL